MSDGTIEVLVGRERRRRWGLQEKLRIVAESEEPGASVRAVAVRHDIYPRLLHTWRRQVRQGRLTATVASPRFVPVHLSEDAAFRAPDRAPVRPLTATIEIMLPDGSCVVSIRGRPRCCSGGQLVAWAS